MEFQPPDNEDSEAVKVTGSDHHTQIHCKIKSLPMRYIAADSCGAWNGLRRLELGKWGWNSSSTTSVDYINNINSSNSQSALETTLQQ